MSISIEELRERIQDAAEKKQDLHLSVEETALLADFINIKGEGLTLGEIMASGVFGGWAHRDDIEDGAKFAEELRRKAERRD